MGPGSNGIPSSLWVREASPQDGVGSQFAGCHWSDPLGARQRTNTSSGTGIQRFEPLESILLSEGGTMLEEFSILLARHLQKYEHPVGTVAYNDSFTPYRPKERHLFNVGLCHAGPLRGASSVRMTAHDPDTIRRKGAMVKM
jgi:hypothetical protein